MRPRIVWTILAKEIVDTLRDRRTLFAMFVMPILLYPILFTWMGRLHAGAEAERKAMRPDVVTWGPLPEPARAALVKEFGDHLRAEPLAPADPAAAARALVESQQADLVIAAPADAAERWGRDAGLLLDAWYDEVRPRSEEAWHRADKAIAGASSVERDARLVRRALPERFDRPLALERHDIAGKARRGGEAAGRLLPFILIFSIVLGGLLAAIDLTAGEKERGTLQTLLTAPVHPVEIVAGKYLAVVALSLCGSAANLAAMGFAIQQQIAAAGRDAVEFSLTTSTALAVFAALLPCALLFSAILLALSVFARSFREANAYLSPVLLGLSLPAIVAMQPTVELGPATAFAPVVNVALLVRELLKGPVPASLYGLVMLANMAYATLAVLFAARVFETEQVLLGGERPWRDLFGDARRARVTPSPRQAVFFVAMLVVLVYYGGLFLMRGKIGGVGALAALQLGFLLAPALVFLIASRLDVRETLLLRLPARRARGLAGALLLAVGTPAVGALISQVEMHLFPNARDYYEVFRRALTDIDAPLALAVVAVGLLPAIGEEVCFRGVVLSGFANTGSRLGALLGMSALFGLFHFNPYHAVGAGALGLMFGVAALESGSLLPGVLAHFVNNSLAMVLLRRPSLEARLDHWWVLALGCGAAAAGLLLLRGTRRAAGEATGSAAPPASRAVP